MEKIDLTKTIKPIKKGDLIILNDGMECYLFSQTYNVIISFRYSYRGKPFEEIWIKKYDANGFIPPENVIEKQQKINYNLDENNYILFNLIIDNIGLKLEVIEGLEFISNKEKNKIGEYI